MLRNKGFTLIELMVTVIIIGILAAIVYPSYIEQVRKTRRTNAESDLVELASFMERYYTQNFTYLSGGNAVTLPFTESPKDGTSKYYDLKVAATKTTFTLSAVPKNSQASDSCGTLTLTQTGQHGAAKSDCW